MSRYILRLDDACERRNQNNWNRIETLCDTYHILPLVGVIPHCEDSAMSGYPLDNLFWKKVAEWIEKGWTIALHGYDHVYISENGGG